MVDFKKLSVIKRKETVTAFIIGDAMGAITDKMKSADIGKFYDYPVRHYVRPITNKFVGKIGDNTWRYHILTLLMKSYKLCDNSQKRIEKFIQLLKIYALSKAYKIGDGDLMLNLIIASISKEQNKSFFSYAAYQSYFLFILALFASIINDGIEFIVTFNRILFYGDKTILNLTLRLYSIFNNGNKTIEENITKLIIDDTYASNLLSKVLICLKCKDFESLLIKSCNDFTDLSADLVSLSSALFVINKQSNCIPDSYIISLFNSKRKIDLVWEFVNYVQADF